MIMRGGGVECLATAWSASRRSRVRFPGSGSGSQISRGFKGTKFIDGMICDTTQIELMTTFPHTSFFSPARRSTVSRACRSVCGEEGWGLRRLQTCIWRAARLTLPREYSRPPGRTGFLVLVNRFPGFRCLAVVPDRLLGLVEMVFLIISRCGGDGYLPNSQLFHFPPWPCLCPRIRDSHTSA